MPRRKSALRSTCAALALSAQSGPVTVKVGAVLRPVTARPFPTEDGYEMDDKE